mgnify:FL=1
MLLCHSAMLLCRAAVRCCNAVKPPPSAAPHEQDYMDMLGLGGSEPACNTVEAFQVGERKQGLHAHKTVPHAAMLCCCCCADASPLCPAAVGAVRTAERDKRA